VPRAGSLAIRKRQVLGSNPSVVTRSNEKYLLASNLLLQSLVGGSRHESAEHRLTTELMVRGSKQPPTAWADTVLTTTCYTSMVVSDMVVQQDDGSGIIGVNQAAHMLGLQPRSVLRLIKEGQLPASKEFGRWRILRDDVEIRRELGAHDGRRYAPAKAWGLILLGSGGQAQWLDRISRWRIRKRLASGPWSELRHAVAGRASHRRYAAHPDSIARLHDEPGLMHSGLSAAEASGVGVISAGDRFEAYVPGGRLPDIVGRNHLRGDPGGLVALRAVLPVAFPEPLPKVAPQMAIALDLLEDHEPRARQVGRELLAALEAEYRIGTDDPADG
jgi:hypothetical protein